MAHLTLSAARPDGVTVARVIAPDRRFTASVDYNPDGRPQRLPNDLQQLARFTRGPVVLDGRGVELIDSTGVGIVLSLWKGLRAGNRPLGLCAPETIRQVFEVARLTRLIPAAADVASAARAVLPASAAISPEPPVSAESWAADPDPYHRLETLPPGIPDRKRRLFAVACGRRVGHLLGSTVCRRAMEVAEAHADGAATDGELEHAHAAATGEVNETRGRGRLTAPMAAAAEAAHPDATAAAWLAAAWAGEIDGPDPLVGVVADVFGNPFRPARFDPCWLTTAVRDLAWQVDHEADFELLPALGEALATAGCENVELLAHCATAGPHVRGCWAVDTVLGK